MRGGFQSCRQSRAQKKRGFFCSAQALFAFLFLLCLRVGSHKYTSYLDTYYPNTRYRPRVRSCARAFLKLCQFIRLVSWQSSKSHKPARSMQVRAERAGLQTSAGIVADSSRVFVAPLPLLNFTLFSALKAGRGAYSRHIAQIRRPTRTIKGAPPPSPRCHIEANERKTEVQKHRNFCAVLFNEKLRAFFNKSKGRKTAIPGRKTAIPTKAFKNRQLLKDTQQRGQT